MDRLLLPSKEPYHKVQVFVKHRPDGKPEALVAYMLRAYTYTADVVKMEVNANYGVLSVDRSYAGDEEDYPGTPLTTLSVKPGRVPDMVFGTPVPEIPTAKAGVDYAYKVATLRRLQGCKTPRERGQLSQLQEISQRTPEGLRQHRARLYGRHRPL